MKKLNLFILLTVIFVSIISCQGRKDINFKRDFEYFYNVINKAFEVTVKYIHLGNADKGLDLVEKYVGTQTQKLNAMGKRLNSVILTQKESLEIVRFNERYASLHAKHVQLLDTRLTAEQKRRFVTLVVEGIVMKMMSQLKVPGSSMEFYKKFFR